MILFGNLIKNRGGSLLDILHRKKRRCWVKDIWNKEVVSRWESERMKAKLRANDLKRIVDGTKKFLSKNDYNKLMCYIYLEVDAEKMEIKATALDGHRVSVEYARVVEVDESFKCYIKPNIPKITKHDLYAELELLDKKAYLMVGENITGYVQPGGVFYNVEKFVTDVEKAPIKASVGVNVQLFKEALESVAKGSKYVKIEVREPNQPISIIPTEKSLNTNCKYVLPVNIGHVSD